jgi:hypothetical protein
MDRRRNITTPDNAASKITPRTRQTASLFVADWIENAPNERHDSRESVHDFEMPRSFARRKNVPRSGPISAMYFGNDVFLNPRNRPSREVWESENPRLSRKLVSPDDINDRLPRMESETTTGRFRQVAPPSPLPSVISLADDTPPIQREKREGGGSSQRTSKSPSKSTRTRKVNTTSSQELSPDRDMFFRERELFLKDRALFLREREIFLAEKQQFHSEKDALIQQRGDLTNTAISDIVASLLKLSGTVQSSPSPSPIAYSSRSLQTCSSFALSLFFCSCPAHLVLRVPISPSSNHSCPPSVRPTLLWNARTSLPPHRRTLKLCCRIPPRASSRPRPPARILPAQPPAHPTRHAPVPGPPPIPLGHRVPGHVPFPDHVPSPHRVPLRP